MVGEVVAGFWRGGLDPHDRIRVTVNSWPARLLGAAALIEIDEPIVACRDPKDDKFLELTVNRRADLIVSGDADLLALDLFRDVSIVTPSIPVSPACGAANGAEFRSFLPI